MNLRQVYWHNEKQSSIGEDTFVFCPMCGGRLAQKQIDHQTRRFCLGCGYTHFRNPAPTVSLLIVEGDRVLLGKRPAHAGRDCWATPSGYIEFDEDFLTTAVREAKEETGLDVAIASILNVTDSFFLPDQHFINIYLLAYATGGQLQPGDDMGELAWFPLEEPLPEMVFQEDIDLIKRYRQAERPCLPVERGG